MTEPLGNSGVQVDLTTGQPLESRQGEKLREARARLAVSEAEAFALRGELAQDGGRLLRLLEERMLARAEEVLGRDEQFAALAGFAESLGLRARGVIAKLVRHRLVRQFGEDLYMAATAAPEGTPAEE